MAKTACNPDRETFQRISARAFVIMGGVFWMAAALAAGRGFGVSIAAGSGLVSFEGALLPLVLTIVVFGIGWFFEYLASAILVIISAIVMAWGVQSGWEPGVWALMLSTLVAPMMISATLYFLAARMEGICRLESREVSRVPAA